MFVVSFTAPPSSEIFTLSLHDALPIWDEDVAVELEELRVRDPFGSGKSGHRAGLPLVRVDAVRIETLRVGDRPARIGEANDEDRKSTRLNSSHRTISYAVFCLKKKKIP